MKTALWAGVSALTLFSAALPALAQDVDDEIITTATKREQTLLETPIAVSVVGETAIERAEIQDILDLQSLVPSLRVVQGGSTLGTNLFIRGFGNGAGNAGIEPSVGVFVDGVYRSRTGAALTDLPDLQQVEVLRGPQSTLFGKNALAGVISVTTRAPQFEWGGSVSGTYGNFNAVRLQGDVTGPLSDQVAFSLSGTFNKRDGYATNLATGTELNERDRFGLRGQLLWEPSDDTSIRLIGDYDEINEICCHGANIEAGGVTIAAIGPLGDFNANDPFGFEQFTNLDPTNEIRAGGVSLHVDHAFEHFDFTSITAYRYSRGFSELDFDGTSAGISQSFNDNEFDTFTQEVRLSSNNPDARVDWLIGGLYFDEVADTEGENFFAAETRPFVDNFLALIGAPGVLGGVEAALTLPIGQTFFGEGQGVIETRDQDNMALTLFGNADLHLTDQLTATVGLAYNYDEKEVTLTQVNTDIFSSLTLPPSVAFLSGFQVFPPFQELPNAVEDGRSEDDDVTYTLRLAYDATPNLNVYGSYATGFKASSFNLGRTSRPTPEDVTALQTAGLAIPRLTAGSRFQGPESARVIELGLKGRFFDNRANVQLAVFDQQIDDFQSVAFDGVALTLASAGSQTTQGIELESTFQPTDGLIFGVAATYLDAVFDEFVTPDFDLTGETPSGVPDWNTSVFFDYSTEISGLPVFARADWQYTSDFNYVDDADLQAQAEANNISPDNHLVNASIGITTPQDIEVSLWARNLFDEQYFTSVTEGLLQPGTLNGFPNEPQTYGITLRKRW